MRADRLVSLVLLLRQRGQLSAATLADELDVSVRTVVRDIEALSSAGVPVYAERGRGGGYALLPGFRTELTGLNHAEALALTTAGSGDGGRMFGLSPPLASAIRKVLDGMPRSHQQAALSAAQRFLFEPATDLLSRPLGGEALDADVVRAVRAAVLNGHRLRLHYASRNQPPTWQIIDPIGVVTVRDKAYLLATQDGLDRTLRMSRIETAEELNEPAQRPAEVDLERLWEARRAAFLNQDHLTVQLLVNQQIRDRALDLAESVVSESEMTEGPDGGRWSQIEVTFQDLWHAEWAVWQLGTGAEALEPPELRVALRRRVEVLADRYRDSPEA